MNLDLYRDEVPPKRVELDSGAVLITVPLPSAHSISIGVWLRRGTQDEPAGMGGLAHFMEHMVFKGSENKDAYEIAKDFDRVGAALDAFTTKDYVAFTLKVLPEYFKDACSTLAEMLLRPAFDSEMINLEQDVVCEEILDARDTPEDLLHDAFAARIYGSHPRSRPVLGSPETVKSLNTNTLREQHKSLFCGSNLVISISGCITPELVDYVSVQFNSGTSTNGIKIPNDSDGPFSAATEVTSSAVMKNSRLDIFGQVQQCYFEIGNNAVSFMHEDRVPLVLLTSILGGGMSSRLFQAIREREGLTYTIYSYIDMGRDIGLVSCAGSCSPKKIERVQEIIRQEYNSVLHNNISVEELNSNKAQLKSQLIYSLEGVANQMVRSAKDEIYYGKFQTISDLVQMVDVVSKNDIMDCARKYYNPEDLIYAVHGPES